MSVPQQLQKDILNAKTDRERLGRQIIFNDYAIKNNNWKNVTNLIKRNKLLRRYYREM